MDFEMIQPLLCYLLHPFIQKYSKVWSLFINFGDIFQKMWEESSCQREKGLIINYSSKRKCVGEYNAVSLTMSLLGSSSSDKVP